MSRWVCPACEREFDRAHQAHTCVPGSTVDSTFAGRPAVQRAIYDAVEAHLLTLGPLHVDAVGVGVFLKRQRKLAELRPQARALALWLILPRSISDPRVSRRLEISADRTAHVLRLTRVEDVDEQLTGWLDEAYLAAGAR